MDVTNQQIEHKIYLDWHTRSINYGVLILFFHCLGTKSVTSYPQPVKDKERPSIIPLAHELYSKCESSSPASAHRHKSSRSGNKSSATAHQGALLHQRRNAAEGLNPLNKGASPSSGISPGRGTPPG